jgi:aspartyl-tRNA(Asn)/glutamyl-tRNA(Gln) amidotransferase subunit A
MPQTPGRSSTPPLHAFSAAQLTRAYAAGDLSPVDVAQAVVAQVLRCEPQLHATWDFDPAEALTMARASAARWQQGRALGPLDGVPVTIKENIATQGVAMPLGSAASLLVPAAADAPPAARLREAGAVFVARTTMPDFGMLSSGLSSFHALARNPWDLRKTPGGSSAGAGAAAAAGYGPLHLGTDIGGSIRLPATWCGVVGFKPSDGRVPIFPPYIGRAAGPLTRTVEDAAIAMAVLSRPDTRDATSLPSPDIVWADLPDDPLTAVCGLKIGLVLDAGWGLPLHPEVAAAVNRAAQVLAAAGAIVTPLAGFTTREMADGINGFWRMRSWLDIGALPEERRAKVLPYIRDWVAAASGYSAAQLFHHHSQFAALRDAAVTACAPFDFVISPVAPDVAGAAEAPSPTGDPLRAMEHIAYTLPFNMSGQPAISVPCGHDAAGLPIGLQIAGRRHDDLGVLRLARAWEMLRPAGLIRPWPMSP